MDESFTAVFDALTDEFGDRPALVHGHERFRFVDVRDRANRFANLLAGHDIGLRHDPGSTEAWESPHDHVALYLRNGPDYLIGMLGAWRARACATNINYRYVADELAGVLNDQSAAAIVYHGSFATTLAEVLERLDRTPLLLRVDDGSGDELLPDAIDLATALAAADPTAPPRHDHSPADRYILYTGGTTGAPKGVLWRQGDFMVRALGLARRDGSDLSGTSEVVERARTRARLVSMPLPPFMHGAAHWNALSTWLSGGSVVIPEEVRTFDAAEALRTAARERVSAMVIVGDAFARPLAEALDGGAPPPRDLRHILSSGAILSRPVADRLREHLPDVRILDVLGSSEAGRQAINTTAPHGELHSTFRPDSGTVVLDPDRRSVLEPGDPAIGWLATSGRVPLGYLGDRTKTEATFPTIGGVRFVVAGDRARLLGDWSIELHGRDSVTINSGGEKIFAEEVERALKEHPDVADALVVGRPNDRWGAEVIGVVAMRSGTQGDGEALRTVARRHIAGYKVPKAFVFVEAVPRSPSGKPDYAQAALLARRAT
ncbi:MAG: AMP-binding protein [Actinobacteria bacterium]|nr:AMP-binding protein [Actinomycetota bacterium]